MIAPGCAGAVLVDVEQREVGHEARRSGAVNALHAEEKAYKDACNALDAKAKENPKAFYTNEYLPK